VAQLSMVVLDLSPKCEYEVYIYAGTAGRDGAHRFELLGNDGIRLFQDLLPDCMVVVGPHCAQNTVHPQDLHAMPVSVKSGYTQQECHSSRAQSVSTASSDK